MACTRKVLLRIGTHRLFTQALHLIFEALFTEYYVHGFLLVVDTRSAKKETSTPNGQWRLCISKLGVCVLVIAQVVHVACSVLHQIGVAAALSKHARTWRLVASQSRIPSDYGLAFVFGLSWWSLRLALVPSAVSFTMATAAIGFFSGSPIAFAQFEAPEMGLRRYKDEGELQLVSRAASVGATLIVLVAALLYDGSSPQQRPLREFHWFILLLCGTAVCGFSGLRRWRRSAQGEGMPSGAHEECGVDSRHISVLGATTTLEFSDFVRQTCQRRSIKALLAVRALHCYASIIVVSFFHLFLALGCASHLSAAMRAVILAFVVAAPSLFAPLHVICVDSVGKKRHVLIMLFGVCAVGFLSLVVAFFTRGAARVAAAPAVGAGYMLTRSIVAIWSCGVLFTLQRLLLDGIRDVLDMVQEDVVEEDTILFGRHTSLAAWTRRLCTVVAVPMESLGCIVTILLLAATKAFEGVLLASLSPPIGNTVTIHTLPVSHRNAAAVALELTALEGAFPAAMAPTKMASTVLALLGLQTSGAAVIMLFVWHRYYNLEGKHLQFVQMAIRKRSVEQSVTLV